MIRLWERLSFTIGDRLVRAWQIALIPIGAAIALWYIDPSQVTWLPKCPLNQMTGLYCPGCGITRASHQLLRGHLLAALALNPLVFLIVPVLLYSLYIELSNALGYQHAWPRAFLRWKWAFPLLLALFGVVRNIPIYPFTLLAPH